MPHEYTQFDKDLAGAVVFRFNAVSRDNLLVGFNDNPERIPFQFPPRITSDSRKGQWKDPNLPGTEPVAVFEKSGPREMSFVATYIVDGGEWTTDRISRIVKKFRGYFARVRNTDEGQRGLVVFFRMWNFGDPGNTIASEMSCRIVSVDAKHSDTIVTHCRPGDTRINSAYPLRTDITVELRLWTKGGAAATQDAPGLVQEESPLWY